MFQFYNDLKTLIGASEADLLYLGCLILALLLCGGTSNHQKKNGKRDVNTT